MNIAFFTDTYLPQINGVVTSIEIFKDTLTRKGHNVFIYAPSIQSRKKHEDGPNVFRFRSAKFIFQPEHRISWPYSRVLNHFSKLDIDIIHSHTPFSMGLLAVFLAKKHDIPLVHTYHTLFTEYMHYLPVPSDYGRNFAIWASKSYCNRNHLVIVPSQKIKEELEQYQVTTPMEIIPTGINLTNVRKVHTSGVCESYHIDPDLTYLITISRLGREKNLYFLIDSFQRIHKHNPATRLIMIGDGPEKKPLLKYIAQANLTDKVILTGYIDREKIFPLLKLSTAFVFASKTETQGLVLLEAMSMKVPAVAVDAMGVSYVLKDNCGGYLVREDTHEFSEAVLKLISNKQIHEQKSSEAYQRAMSLSANKMTRRLINAYESLLHHAH